METRNFIKIYETSLFENWDLPALSEYTTRKSLTYGELADKICLLYTSPSPRDS